MSHIPLVKICGIREPEHACVAIEAGADLLGVVFYPPSPRHVSVAQARAVVDVARGSGARVVGLFVNQQADAMNRVADAAGLDIVQLSGDEPPAIIRQVERPVIASVRVDSSGRSDEEERFQAFARHDPAPWAVLIDSHVQGMYGGTGTVADWFVAADFARRFPVILAGGLRPETVAEAIRRVKPFAVDVSSGVETAGHKDSDRIRAFIAAARATGAEGREEMRLHDSPVSR
jgi:phosphoribosylanthranilate isomerase